MVKSTSWIQLVCFFIIAFACLSIGFGSWLETNDLIYSSSSSVNRYLSVFKVTMVSPASTAYLTFGLWRYCVSNDITSTSRCSPIRMNFDIGTYINIVYYSECKTNRKTTIIDAFTIMNNTLNNDQLLPSLLKPISYIRLIPLLISTFLAVISVGIASFLLPSNQKKSVQRKALLWMTSMLCFLSAALTSVTFGVTFYQYSTNIKYACLLMKQQHDNNNINNDNYICSSYTPSVEIILLGLAIGLFIISSIYCIIISSNQFLIVGSSCKTQYTNNSSYSFYASDGGGEDNYVNQTIQEDNINEKAPQEQDDEMVWNTNTNKERLSLRPPPPFNQKAGCRSTITTDNISSQAALKRSQSNKTVTNKNYSRAASNSVVVTPQPNISSSLATTGITATADFNNKFTSSQLSLGSDVLLPPTLPFATHSNGGRPSSSAYSSRPLSHGSDNTFGAFYNSDTNYSPSADDASVASSSYMDYRHQRSDSNTSHATNNNHFMYASGGTQSNHTLGPFTSFNNNNSSFEGDKIERYPTNSSAATENTMTATGSSSINIPQHSNISDSSTSSNSHHDDLYKRINNYLQKQ
jgi:hypothetical protein